jgi:molybdate transport system permease protein
MPMDWFPLWLSLRVALCATAASLAIGVPLAWALAGRSFRGKALLSGLVDLPLVLPSTVLGWYLLVLLGRDGPAGRLYESLTGHPLVFTWQAAVVAATIYAAPLLVRSVRSAIEALDPAQELAARGLGATGWRVFRHVTLPRVRRPVLGATLYAFARSMADFGITILIAGNLPGTTQTLSVAVFDAVSSGHGAAARWLVVAVSALVLGLLVAANRVQTEAATR